MIPVMDGIKHENIMSERITTRVLSAGAEDGVPVVFVHGNLSNATFWEETMLALPAGFRGIAMDQRGYGDADPSKKIDATRGMKDFADDISALLDTLKIEKAHLVGHSLGGSVLWQFLMDYPQKVISLTMVAPGSPYGFGGTKGVDGKACYDDFAGSGGGIVSPDFVRLLMHEDRSADSPQSPRNIMNTFYWKPPFKPEREEELLSAMLNIHMGEDAYPGDFEKSENWPLVRPGKHGPNNAISPAYADEVNKLFALDPKPRILWVRGANDQIVADGSLFEPGTLGAAGAIPGWPGAEVFPPQPMISQTRAVLEQYGNYEEVVIDECGHSPYIEKADEFNKAFHTHLQK